MWLTGLELLEFGRVGGLKLLRLSGAGLEFPGRGPK